MSKKIRLAIISDLHYRRHKEGDACRPATSIGGTHTDPMPSLIRYLTEHKRELSPDTDSIADYLLCPGDIADKADGAAFDEGWAQLKALQGTLGAKHLISSTGNHEIDSRAGEEHDAVGNSQIAIDPLIALQRHSDYPSTALATADRRWVYWGRGYEFIEQEGILFLVINSSHYHQTTRPNEFERGRIGEVALACLREELKIRMADPTPRLLVTLLHHHPIPHQDLYVDLDKIEMDNGPKLMAALSEQQKAWLVVHGHKHHPRLITSQGPFESIVFAAGSFGAGLDGALATRTKLQFYIVECDVLDQTVEPRLSGHIRTLCWAGLEWRPAQQITDGLPDHCGFAVPPPNVSAIATQVRDVLIAQKQPYLTWVDLVRQIPELRNLLPEKCATLRKAFTAIGVKTSWDESKFFPEDAGL